MRRVGRSKRMPGAWCARDKCPRLNGGFGEAQMDGAGQAEVVVSSDAPDLATLAARTIVAAAQRAISLRGRFIWALSGGSTPQRTHSLLAQPEWKTKIDWSRTFIIMGDERFVSP